MAWSQLVSFWILTVFILLLPGPDWAFVIGSGSRGKNLFAAIGGLLAGYWFVIILVAFGVAALVAKVPLVLDILTIVGALYLLFLGLGLVRNPATYEQASERQWSSARTLFANGFGVSGLNPKGLLFFLVLLPQFTKTGLLFPLYLQILILGVVFTFSFVPFYLLLGSLTVKWLKRKPQHMTWVSRASGMAMILLGIGLALQRFT
jgi:threonine/homoserine/homoserine lactone efflux protein